MRINFAVANKNTTRAAFIREFVKAFQEDFEFKDAKFCWAYISHGRQGLDAFVEFMKSKGWKISAYYLPPNKDLFIDVGEDWSRISRTSPSYGVVIEDDDPKWVEFKLRHG